MGQGIGDGQQQSVRGGQGSGQGPSGDQACEYGRNAQNFGSCQHQIVGGQTHIGPLNQPIAIVVTEGQQGRLSQPQILRPIWQGTHGRTHQIGQDHLFDHHRQA